MLIVFFGSNRNGVWDAATKYIEQNFPEGASLTTLEATDYEMGQISSVLGTNSLFGGQQWFVLDRPSNNPDFNEDVQSVLKEIKESNNVFILLEQKLSADLKKKLIRLAEVLEEFESEKEISFNPFLLAEALADKNKKKLWLLLQEAKWAGLKEEEIIGILWWQLKTLRLASLTKTSAEAGIKDFPYTKAKKSLSKFTEQDVSDLSQSLLELYHAGHAGLRDIGAALEEWTLRI